VWLLGGQGRAAGISGTATGDRGARDVAADAAGDVAVPGHTDMGARDLGKKLPIEKLLRPDGTLGLTAGYAGAVDLTGYTMTTGADGAPRFIREGSASSSPACDPDRTWDDGFFPNGPDSTTIRKSSSR
jgi:hypothetical protein